MDENAIFLCLAVLLIYILIIAVLKKSAKKTKKRYDNRKSKYDSTLKNTIEFNDYNADEYKDEEYNSAGKNSKGQYNRYYDKKSADEEGFISPYISPVALTDHARERMIERMGITDFVAMKKRAVEAYKFGKSKRQIKKTSAFLVEEIEQKHEDGIVLIYKNFIYVFSRENVLITVYKNDKIIM